jgi:hypothetical protein
MKIILSLVTVLFFALSANAQFVQGPSQFTAITNPTTIPMVIGATLASNTPAGAVRAVTAGPNGFGVGVSWSGSAAALASLAFEPSIDGVRYATLPSQWVFVTVTNTGSGSQTFYTNIQPTSPNVGNAATWRLKYITNNTSSALTFSNIVILTR